MKRIVVTGAAGGIGSASVAALRRRGAHVVGLDLRAGDGVIACDVRDQESVDAAIATALEELGGGLDVLVNNAGIGTPQSAGVRPDEGALAVLDVNLVGPWRVTAAALEPLRAARGRVVNVASGLAHMAIPFAPAYCMSKRGLVAYSDSLRLEHGDALTVTTVYPGYVRTAIHAASREVGLGLEGLVPPEPVEAVARTITRAALGRPARDLATTPGGAVGIALMRYSPRGVVDRTIMRAARRGATRGGFSRAGLAGEFVERVSGANR